jgi:anaerobic selenocysteine-containing dehydrogenase
MRVQIEDNRIRRIEPHTGNLATPEGVCLKGLSYYERVHSPDRILTPLLRKGPPGRADREAFEPVPWPEALDLITDRLTNIRAESGPQSLLYYAATGTKGLLNSVGPEFWKLFGGYTTTFGDLCWPAGLEATRLTLGDNKHSAPWDLANARLIVFWGKNAAETNIHQMVFVERALEAGGKLVVIDPRRTETAERADLFIQPRPGTDGALALAVARQIIADGHVDGDFIGRHVSGFDEFAASVRDFTPEHAAAITEVPEEQIRRLAELLGTAAPATISPGYGMQRYTNSGQAMRALLALLVITGNLGKPGAGWVYANLQSLIFDDVKEPLACYPPATPSDNVRVSISTARLGRDMLATTAPPLRAAWVERGNPVTQNPETHKVLKAFRALEFRVVVDQFLTDTAREADLVLPAKTMFEQSDVIGAYWHPYVQLKQKMLEPPGEVKPESEIYRLLAERFGFDAPDLDERIPPPGDEAIERWLERRLEPFPEITLDRLREGPVLPPGHEEVAFSDLVFPTPSGKIELVSHEAAERWNTDPLPGFTESVESLRREPGRYRLHFMTPNTKNRIHSQFQNLRMIRQFGDRPFVQIHPADAGVRGIVDGSRVRIVNDRGELTVDARLDPGIKPGCVAVTNGWWMEDGGTVNFCSQGRETDIGHGAAFHDNLVEVEPAS